MHKKNWAYLFERWMLCNWYCKCRTNRFVFTIWSTGILGAYRSDSLCIAIRDSQQKEVLPFPQCQSMHIKRYLIETIKKNKESSLLSFISNFLLENYFIKKRLTTLSRSEKVSYYDFTYSDVSDKVWKLVQLSFPSAIPIHLWFLMRTFSRAVSKVICFPLKTETCS